MKKFSMMEKTLGLGLILALGGGLISCQSNKKEKEKAHKAEMDKNAAERELEALRQAKISVKEDFFKKVENSKKVKVKGIDVDYDPYLLKLKGEGDKDIGEDYKKATVEALTSLTKICHEFFNLANDLYDIDMIKARACKDMVDMKTFKDIAISRDAFNMFNFILDKGQDKKNIQINTKQELSIGIY